MCVSCGCGRPADNHGDERAIVLADLQAAADQCGCSVPDVVGNIARTMAGGAAPKAEKRLADTASVVVLKAAVERRYTLGVAYPAMKPDVTVAADGHRDFVSPDALEKTAWEWMAKHRDVNLFHREDTSGHATVVESYIYRGPDWRISSPVDGQTYVVKAGDWLIGTIWDEPGWELVKRGLVNGWSPEGGARRRTPAPEALARLRS
jgi:hypothetical protein